MSNLENPVEVSAVEAPKIKQSGETNMATTASQPFSFIKEIPVTVTVVLGEVMMNIENILTLGPGSMIPLQREINEPIDLLVNNKLVAKGEIVALENHFGLRITHVVPGSKDF